MNKLLLESIHPVRQSSINTFIRSLPNLMPALILYLSDYQDIVNTVECRLRVNSKRIGWRIMRSRQARFLSTLSFASPKSQIQHIFANWTCATEDSSA